MRRALSDRISALERRDGLKGRPGFVLLWTLVHVDGQHTDSDVVAVEVGEDRVRFERLPGESLDALEARANPRGSLHAAPSPVFCDHYARAVETRTDEERHQAFQASLRNLERVAGRA